MSGSAQGSSQMAKKGLAEDSPKTGETAKEQLQGKPAASLEEDDEFEDFPVEDWTQEDVEGPEGNAHLWEESWDDDDTSEDFSAQLKEELKKVESSGRRG
ncbi:MAG: 26S proteasome complex subunit [Sarea resinae]|nr:MAG: 26S proteasome complex subunit [Sarea resinae]